ncbi:F-box protein At2g32560-like isoform X2 [Actinidia eriantha]|uniref:F-box protein At2g32560-like isoform X2 n=1 Tax=Actinidia eriantha TaxID=165200 RepID=UPI00258544D2|nr:F-box protein At2g32560-like isoform X2 [Actinidia eriantha]
MQFASLRPNSNTHLGEIHIPMIFLMISFFSFILLSKSFSLMALPIRKSVIAITCFDISPVKETRSLKAENVREREEISSLLDLPEFVLECILERLSPTGLFTMAGVCTSLREKCTSDHLWERHMKQKWGRLIGDAAYSEWQWHIASRKRSTLSKGTKRKTWFGNVSSLWPVLWNKSKLGTGSETRSSVPEDSVMAWYLALESGTFWFPAQVYNRENGNIGFMLSCYDAELSYDSSTDTFKASYSPHGRRTIEDGIEWDRLRAPAVDNPAHVVHVSDCLDDLKPGDHIEIQWRRTKEFPYGWWYGVVGHMQSCSGNKTHCQCHKSDTVMLEFKQYTAGSQWRQMTINRKTHSEVGNGAAGFYGGIRKLYNEEEISVWKRHWQFKVVE